MRGKAVAILMTLAALLLLGAVQAWAGDTKIVNAILESGKLSANTNILIPEGYRASKAEITVTMPAMAGDVLIVTMGSASAKFTRHNETIEMNFKQTITSSLPASATLTTRSLGQAPRHFRVAMEVTCVPQ